MSAKDQIFDRIRRANAFVTTAPGTGTDQWHYGQGVPVDDAVAVFEQRVRDYSATVVHTDKGGVAQAIATAAGVVGAGTLVVPDGVPQQWRDALESAGVELKSDTPPLSNQDLDGIDGVITAAGAGIADTGTIVLNHMPDQGRRALTLVPDRHICVIRTDQVVGDVPQAITAMRPFVEQGQPLTFISGASATSDIELQRVDGVHGPRTLYVIVVG